MADSDLRWNGCGGGAHRRRVHIECRWDPRPQKTFASPSVKSQALPVGLQGLLPGESPSRRQLCYFIPPQLCVVENVIFSGGKTAAQTDEHLPGQRHAASEGWSWGWVQTCLVLTPEPSPSPLQPLPPAKRQTDSVPAPQPVVSRVSLRL